MMTSDNVPTLSEIRRYLGSSIAEVIFDYSHPYSKKLLGLIPPLDEPQEELWISPSDQLIEKVALVPPLTNKCIKACTHQGILVIGERAMKKYENELQNSMQKKFEEDNREVRKMFEAEKRREIQLAEKELRSKYEPYLATLQEEFARKLQIALAESFKKCTKMMQKAVIRERIEVTRMMLKKLRQEISYIITTIYENFDRKKRAQKENMIADFNEIVRRERAKTKEKLEEMERKKTEALRVQRHELEMQNTADVMYVLCSERMRYSSEKHAIHLGFEKQIQSLKNLLKEANDIIDLMKTETTAVKQTDNKSWENKLLEVVREFQKFINFAFKAVPGQAEFLLSLESLLILETDDKLRNQKVLENESFESAVPADVTNPEFEIVEIIDAAGEKWIPMQLVPDLPKLYCTKDQLMSPIVKSEIDFYSNDEYAKVRSNASVSSLNSYRSLPFCCLDNTMYVRSDYHEKNEIVTKTMSQLAEDSRFIMELKKLPKPCNPKIINHITDSVSTANTSRSPSSSNPITDRNSDGSLAGSAVKWIKQNSVTDNPSKIQGISDHLKMAENISVDPENQAQTFRVVGEDGIEHLQTSSEFTCARMRSLMRIFKLHPSLQRMLIPKADQFLC